MKKSLFWMLGALAVSGLFTFSACDEDEEVKGCATENPCEDTTRCYDDASGKAQCSEIDCTGRGYTTDGKCKDSNLAGRGEACSDQNGCQQGLVCVNNVCDDEQANDYRYVRIDDVSVCGKSSCGEDPGADIDAIVLKKGGNNSALKYADNVEYYSRGDGKPKAGAEAAYAGNPEMAKGAPDSITSYPNPDGTCYYYKAGAQTEKTFVDLGGNGGVLIVRMSDVIANGDVIDVLEVGDCDLYNTKSKPNAKDGTHAGNEEIEIFISVGNEKSGEWKTLGKGTATKGVISKSVNVL